jgi:hypothetical protein
MSRWTSVDFPEPEGAEMMKTLIIAGGEGLGAGGGSGLGFSFEIQGLFADFFYAGFGSQCQVGDA